jgi:hypothetical protein
MELKHSIVCPEVKGALYFVVFGVLSQLKNGWKESFSGWDDRSGEPLPSPASEADIYHDAACSVVLTITPLFHPLNRYSRP